MIQLVTLNKDEIIIDPAAAGFALDKAVRRERPLRFTGICPVGDAIIFVFVEAVNEEPDDSAAHFIFSELTSMNFDETSAVILQRFTAGYDTLGSFLIDGRRWGLFKQLPKDGVR